MLHALWMNGPALKRAVCGATLGLLTAGTWAQDRPVNVEYRTYDGRGNNRFHTDWGNANVPYLREASGAHYADGRSVPPGADRPSARIISNMVSAQGPVETEDERGLSTCVYEFGQFLDHDIGLAMDGAGEEFDVPVPAGDPWFDPNSTGTQVIPLVRSGFAPGTGVHGPRQQVNTVTSFIDASQIYGSDPVRAAWLRAGTGGRLKVHHESYGDMLPYNDGTLPNANPLGLPATSLFVAGDVRANEQTGLLVLHTAFLREHNWHADRLHAVHPSWSDERLYQEARRTVGAEMQVIVYKEFLPALLGRPLSQYRGYKPWVHPGLSNAFATAAYRVGHSMVGPDIDLLDENFQPFGLLDLADAFFNPGELGVLNGVSPVVRYFSRGHQQITDTMVVDPLRNFLFGPPGAGGLDLASLNIQRGRDHGLGDYNTVRRDFGLPRVTSFSQITSDPVLATELQLLYGSVNKIDAWVGMLAEDHLPGSSLGRTHVTILTDQFERLRDGDRFWYQNGNFSQADLAMIESTRLSTILTRTTGTAGLQANMFYAAP